MERTLMNFLEAKQLVEKFGGGPPLRLLLALSGTAQPMEIFVKAAAAEQGFALELRLLPFNTLQQAVLSQPVSDEQEVFLLFPWDLVPELDWRSGVPSTRLDPAAVLTAADQTLGRLAARPRAVLLYLPALIPPASGDDATDLSLTPALTARAVQAGARLLSAEDFSLGSYFASGLPIAARSLGKVARAVIEVATTVTLEPAKLLVSDLDNTLWRGVIAEDGVAGISCEAEGAGYRHFVYQTFLRRLKDEGVLLAAVSRNSLEVALTAFASGRMTLQENDFVHVVASYHAKSAQIRELARQLNLGLSATVFVDDNPLELHEVAQQLPEVQCIAFPKQDDGLPEVLAALSRRFRRTVLTAEDRIRTELYRRRLGGMVPLSAEGGDLREFLRDLRMRLIVRDRSSGDRVRAVQLINKTNQFNLNGRRVTDDEVSAILAAGGTLFTATLEDRTGSHGEILATLITGDRRMTSFVLSCRVFQRRVEQAFCAWLADQAEAPAILEYAPTERNEPFRMFLRDPAFDAAASPVAWDSVRYAREHKDDLALFELAAHVRA